MNYAAIRYNDIANGEGVRTSLFVSGCTNHCPGCFNPEEQDFNYGSRYTADTSFEIINSLKKETVSGLSILGGDPLCQTEFDINRLTTLVDMAHEYQKNVWLWTGFVWEDIFSDPKRKAEQVLLLSCDVVVDGPFKQELSDRALVWRGSANQRVIDVKETIKQGKIVLYHQ